MCMAWEDVFSEHFTMFPNYFPPFAPCIYINGTNVCGVSVSIKCDRKRVEDGPQSLLEEEFT